MAKGRVRHPKDEFAPSAIELMEMCSLRRRLRHDDPRLGYRTESAGNSDGETFEEMFERQGFNTDNWDNLN